jgi:4-diphosphocytidyl-2-C-methyl-D-erythritol kinase
MVELMARAKLTLSLRITGTRADGFHELDAVMATAIEPHDIVTIEPAARMSIEVGGPFARGVPADASNLAWRAAEACGAVLAIRIHKGIPPGAGLGGGSADAAAVLTALGGDAAIGARLGADVPFCMLRGAARVRGIGELLEPVSMAPRPIVIVTPRFACATAEVYRVWDELGGPHAEPNDLEPAAFRLEPRLAEFKAALEAAAGAPATLAGSGSSFWVPGDDANRLRDRIDGWSWSTTVPS